MATKSYITKKAYALLEKNNIIEKVKEGQKTEKESNYRVVRYNFDGFGDPAPSYYMNDKMVDSYFKKVRINGLNFNVIDDEFISGEINLGNLVEFAYLDQNGFEEENSIVIYGHSILTKNVDLDEIGGEASYDSPIGQAFRKNYKTGEAVKVGEIKSVEVPSGSFNIKILNVYKDIEHYKMETGRSMKY